MKVHLWSKEMIEERMREHKRLIMSPWVQNPIFLKTQPWNRGGSHSAWLYEDDKLAVVEVETNTLIKAYDDLDLLVFDWAVD